MKKDLSRRKQDYHLKIPNSMYRVIARYALDEGITVNRLIVEWVRVGLDNIKLLYNTLGNQHTRYEIVGYNENQDVHLWVESYYYEKIKGIHGNSNTFSLAQIVRNCIIMVLGLIDQYGNLRKAMLALQILNRALRNKKVYRRAQGYVMQIRLILNNTRLTWKFILLYVFFLNLRL